MNDYKSLRQIFRLHTLKIFFLRGCKELASMKCGICTMFASTLYIEIATQVVNGFTGPMKNLYATLYIIMFSTVGLIALFIEIFILGLPNGYVGIMWDMCRVGLSNALGEVPVLIERRKSTKKKNSEIWTFEASGVPFSAWVDFAEKLESALDIAFISAEPGDNGRTVALTIIPNPKPWPQMLLWDNSLLSAKESVLILGENRSEQVSLDLAVVPHLLIAGRTGSGKSVLQKSLMLQALLHGTEIILVDYKLGVDYGKNWRKYCEFICDDDSFLERITDLQREMMRRFNLLNESDCSNIQEYNSKGGTLHRICLFIDEIVECFDRKDVSAEQKKILAAISLSISSICRLGRAAGIHVILATQRGSADVLPGQIRSNVFKMLGSADENLSILTLGNADAAKKIPADAQGRFIDERGNMFQSYYSEYGDDVFAPIENREAHR